MEVLTHIKNWAAGIADVAVSLMAMFIALEVLLKGSAVAFLPAFPKVKVIKKKHS
jgi:hypothetical protein